ncbi:(2Fe-2S)-binding protein [Rhodoferax lacus]|uniref:(2Fe-2S)-binding protein n=1 Tax=Rhodoferax lacus TaxID=2184758 RepID=A0A3E1RB65_9BURK|nr:(2Fe-2S)-binding protein [Rhodoferax lacus]
MNAAPSVVLQINGRAITVTSGVTVAAALALAAMPATRTSVSGEARTPLCGMGICQECRVRVNGRVRLACQTLCVDGMQVERLP